MVTVLVIIVVVGLGVAVYEIASSRRKGRDDTRAQLDALSRVVEPQRRRPPAVGAPTDPPSADPHAPSAPD